MRKERTSNKTANYINNYIKCACMLSCSVMSNSVQPIDCSPPGSSICRIFQARILVWVAISYTRGSSLPRDWTHVSCISCTGRWNLYDLHHLGSPTLSVNDPNTLIQRQTLSDIVLKFQQNGIHLRKKTPDNSKYRLGIWSLWSSLF